MQSIIDMINHSAPFIAVLSTAQSEKHMVKSTVISIVSAVIIGIVAGGFGTYVTVQLIGKDIQYLQESIKRVEQDQNRHENNHLNGLYDDGGRG